MDTAVRRLLHPSAADRPEQAAPPTVQAAVAPRQAVERALAHLRGLEGALCGLVEPLRDERPVLAA